MTVSNKLSRIHSVRSTRRTSIASITGAEPTTANKRPPSPQRLLEARIVNRHRPGDGDDIILAQRGRAECIARFELYACPWQRAKVRGREGSQLRMDID